MTRPRLAVIATLLGLTLLGFFEFPGRAWLQQDTQIWIPMLEHIWDPAALQSDIVALKPHLSFTLYDEAAITLRWVTRTSFHAVLVFEQIALRLLELLGAFLLVRSFGLTRRMSILVAACFGLGATIVGPSVLTFEYEPVPRGFALGFLFLAIGLVARGQALLGGCAAALGFVIHAPTAVPICILFFVLIAIRRGGYRPLIPVAIAFVVLLIASRFQAGATETQPFFERIDPDWERIERLRASYNWVSVWVSPLIWQYLLFGALTMLGVWRLRPKGGRLFVIGLPLIGLLSVPVSYVLTERVKWALMPQIQPARALLWVTALTVIVGAAAAVCAAKRRIWWEAILWFTVVFVIPIETRIADITVQHLLLAIAMAVLATAAARWHERRAGIVLLTAAIVIPYFAIPIAGHVGNYPQLHTPAIEELVAYARTSTPKDAMFLFPDAGRDLYPGLFRAEALRSVYVDWKAGGQVNYFRSLAEDWWSRWQATMSGQNIASNLGRFKELGIDYIVMKKSDPIVNLGPVYSNSGYLVYRISQP